MFARPTDLGICVSRAVAENAQASYYVARDRLRTVYNCLDLSRFRQIAPDARPRVRADLGIRSDARVLALVGRFYAVKGQEEMIRMMPAIAARCPDVVLILVGDGPCRAACESLAAQLNIQSHLRFLGQRGDVADLLEASDLVVMPSQNEGFPLAVIEALAIGRPVVGLTSAGWARRSIAERPASWCPRAIWTRSSRLSCPCWMIVRRLQPTRSVRLRRPRNSASVLTSQNCSSATEKSELLPCELLQQASGLPLLDSSRAFGIRSRPSHGAIAQLGERYNGIVEVGGSIPPGSTIPQPCV